MKGSTGSTGDFVASTRGGIIESRHVVNAAIVDQTGRQLGSLGDPSRLTLIRSAAKPAQTVAILESLQNSAPDIYNGLTPDEIALMCASHSSEPRHVDTARRILAKAGTSEDHLSCGGHPSISHRLAAEWAQSGYKPTRINSNCSGKHAGMIAANIALGGQASTYASPSSPMQAKVRDVVEEFTGLRPDEVKWAVDGCNLPAPALPLEATARMFAAVAASAEEASSPDDTAAPRIAPGRRQLAAQLWQSVISEPLYIAGEGRFCSLLATLGKGSMMGKVGADGCYGVGVRPSTITRALGAEGSVGIAIKIEDGNQEVLYMAVTEILLQLGILSEKDKGVFKEFHGKKRLNTADEVIGGWEFSFDLRGLRRRQQINGYGS